MWAEKELGSIHTGGYYIQYPQLIHGRQWDIFWILDMGYRIWDTGYGLWIRSKEPKFNWIRGSINYLHNYVHLFHARCVLYPKVTSTISIWICTLVKLDTGYWIWYPPLWIELMTTNIADHDQELKTGDCNNTTSNWTQRGFLPIK